MVTTIAEYETENNENDINVVEETNVEFIQFPNIIDDLPLSAGAFRYYVALKRAAGSGGKTFAGNKIMGERCGFSKKTIIKYKKELSQPFDLLYGKPLIYVQERKKANGGNTSDLIIIADVWEAHYKRIAERKKVHPTPSEKNTPPPATQLHNPNENSTPLSYRDINYRDIPSKEGSDTREKISEKNSKESCENVKIALRQETQNKNRLDSSGQKSNKEPLDKSTQRPKKKVQKKAIKNNPDAIAVREFVFLTPSQLKKLENEYNPDALEWMLDKVNYENSEIVEGARKRKEPYTFRVFSKGSWLHDELDKRQKWGKSQAPWQKKECDVIEKNMQWARDLYNKPNNHPDLLMEVREDGTYVGRHRNNPFYKPEFFKYTENGFQERVLNHMRKEQVL